MSFTFDRYPVFDAGEATTMCADAGIPAPFAGRANSFTNPLGGAPGRGWLLMLRRDLDKLKIGEGLDTLRTLTITDPSGDERPLKFPAVLMTGHLEAVHPGFDSDEQTLYMVEIADRRWLEWERGTPHIKAYNYRFDTDAQYVSTTLNEGTAWTWAQLLADLWPSSLGTAPTLPVTFTPHGTPENFWYQGETKLWAFDHVLTRLRACQPRQDVKRNCGRSITS